MGAGTVRNTGADPRILYRAWTDHRFYRYRGCAPDAVDPTRMAGDPSLPVGAHHAPDVDGGEPQKDRIAREAAAVEVCLSCPVMVQCDAYASSVTADGHLAEPEGVWGGRLALERHRAFIARRHQIAGAAPDSAVRTPQKLAVLQALAVVWEPSEVAERAGVVLGEPMDVRTANWQRSSLIRLLGLPKDATRAQLLAVAQERGLLEGVRVVADDGRVPAVPPPSRTSPASETAPTVGPRVLEDAVPSAPDPAPMAGPVIQADADVAHPVRPARLPAPRRTRYAAIPGQLALWPARTRTNSPSHSLTKTNALEAAA